MILLLENIFWGFLNWIILNFQCFPYLLDIYINPMMKPYSLKWDWTKVLNGVPNIPIVITDPFSFSNYSWNRNFLPTILSFLTWYNAELLDFMTYHTKLHCFIILSRDSLSKHESKLHEVVSFTSFAYKHCYFWWGMNENGIRMCEHDEACIKTTWGCIIQ